MPIMVFLHGSDNTGRQMSSWFQPLADKYKCEFLPVISQLIVLVTSKSELKACMFPTCTFPPWFCCLYLASACLPACVHTSQHTPS